MLTYSVLIPVISGVLVALMAVYVLTLRKSVSNAEKRNSLLIDSLSKEVQGISHGAMGVGRKVLLLEKEVELLKAQLEEAQKNDPSKVSYSEASRLVEMGADIEDLMNSCGISRPEAELVSALTASRKDQVPTLMPERF